MGEQCHLNELEYGLRQLIKRSYDTPANRKKRARLEGRRASLSMVARDLHELGFKHLTVSGLRQKHVKALVTQWQNVGDSPQTIRMRMSDLR